jgi:hypothetical protein
MSMNPTMGPPPLNEVDFALLAAILRVHKLNIMKPGEYGSLGYYIYADRSLKSEYVYIHLEDGNISIDSSRFIADLSAEDLASMDRIAAHRGLQRLADHLYDRAHEYSPNCIQDIADRI